MIYYNIILIKTLILATSHVFNDLNRALSDFIRFYPIYLHNINVFKHLRNIKNITS